MSYIKFKYKNALILILIILALITVNLASPAASLQKRQDPPPPPPQGQQPPGPCLDCANKCCEDFKGCVNGPNPDTCAGQSQSCTDNCNSGACNNVPTFEFHC